jgi:hypothetical protein
MQLLCSRANYDVQIVMRKPCERSTKTLQDRSLGTRTPSKATEPNSEPQLARLSSFNFVFSVDNSCCFNANSVDPPTRLPDKFIGPADGTETKCGYAWFKTPG